MSLWKYFFDRAAYDVTRSALKNLSSPRERSSPHPRDIYLSVWERSIRELAHKKYELVTRDKYGLENEDAWINYLKTWFRSEMLPALRRAGCDPSKLTYLNNTEMPHLMDRIDQMVLQIRRNAAAGLAD